MAIEEMLEEADEEVNVDQNIDDNVNNGRQYRGMRDRYVDVPHVAKPILFIEEWEDGMGLL